MIKYANIDITEVAYQKKMRIFERMKKEIFVDINGKLDHLPSSKSKKISGILKSSYVIA